MSGTQPTPQVLIVGAGPAGLVLAITLLQNNVPVRVIEKATEPRLGQRGAGIMPRSLELFRTLGIHKPVEELAIAPPTIQKYEMPAGVKPFHTFDMTPFLKPTPACPYLNVVMLGQDRQEEIYRTVLAQHKCKVERGTELVDFDQKENHVQVKLRVQGAGSPEDVVEEIVNYDWVIGTDGATGVTRKLLGLSFLGETRAVENLVVGDIFVKGLNSKHRHMWGDASTILVSLRPTETPDLFNLIIAGRDINHSRLASDGEELIRFLKDNTGNRADLFFGSRPWLSHYKPNVRMVDKFGYGRVYLAGDAAHVHSPTGGQGMNSSIQDSFNLGWKLALVVKGLAPKTLLDSYTEERIPVIAEVLNRTTNILKRTFQETDDGPWKRGPALLQLGINYRWSSIVVDEQKKKESTPEEADSEATYSPYGTLDRQLRAGDRAPDAPNLDDIYHRLPPQRLFDLFSSHHHTVLAFTNSKSDWESILLVMSRCPAGTMRAGWIVRPDVSQLVQIENADFGLVDRENHAHTAYDIGEECWIVIVRPDGYIGGILAGAEGLERYCKGIFGAL